MIQRSIWRSSGILSTSNTNFVNMTISFEAIIFLLLLIDSVGSVSIAFFGEQWYTKHFSVTSRYFPAAKGWTVYYLVLVLWAGSLLYRAGMLF